MHSSVLERIPIGSIGGRSRFFWFAHVLIGKPVSTFPGHALWFAHVLVGKPVSTFPGHALWFAHVLVGKPVSTFPGHALEHASPRLTSSGAACRFHLAGRRADRAFITLIPAARAWPPCHDRTTKSRECRARSAVLSRAGRTRPRTRSCARPCTTGEPSSGRRG
jgi:hypothetical protein